MPIVNVVNDFLLYCSSYEIPESYARFSAIGLLGACFNRRIFCMNGDLPIYGTLYAGLIGKSGYRKSTAQDFARDLFVKVYDDIPLGPSVTSKEQIAANLSSGSWNRQYKDHTGQVIDYRPYMFFVNELEDFLSFNSKGMIAFLVNIYDRRIFDASTIKRGLEKIHNPCINFMCCCTDDWLVSSLQGSVISGGFFRRLIPVYEPFPAKNPDGTYKCISDVEVTIPGKEALLRVEEHLKAHKEFAGQFKLTHTGKLYLQDWYEKHKQKIYGDPLLTAYYSTKDIQMRKIAMLLGCSVPNPKLDLTDELLAMARMVLENDVEPNLPSLAVAGGRNELAAPQQQMLGILTRMGGCMLEKDWVQEADTRMSQWEFRDMMEVLKKTERAFLTEKGIPNSRGEIIPRLVVVDRISFIRIQEEKKLGK